MTREQALALWLMTLRSRAPASSDAGPAPAMLVSAWRDAGLGPDDDAALTAAWRKPDDPWARREAMIRATRALIVAHGFDVDTLTTPAAGMRGL